MTRPKLKDFLNYIAMSVIFSGAWSYNYGGFAELRVSYFIITAVFFLWLPFLKGIYCNRTFILIFILFTIASAYNLVAGDNTFTFLSKQVTGVLQNAVFFYLLVKINDYDVKRLFKIYLNLAFFTALIGIFQEISFLVKFKPGYDYSWFLPQWSLASHLSDKFLRVSSILPEPAHFCNVMMPAFFVSSVSFFKNTFKFQGKLASIVIIFSFILSFSTGGYIAVFFAIILLFLNYRKINIVILGLGIIITAFCSLYGTNEVFKAKIDDSLGILSGRSVLGDKINLSTYAIFSNMRVAEYSLARNPVFGSGLGSHPLTYDKHIGVDIPWSNIHHNIQCKGDAGSLFIRLLSETGILGLLIFFVFILKFYISKKSDKTGYLWIISNAVLSMFFIKLLRMGHYFVDGFLFFIWIYYFSKLRLRENLRGESR